MTLPSIAAGGVAKTLIAVTISLHPAAAHQGGGNYVTVKAGDTLSAIADRYGMDWQSLWQANQAEVPDPNLIYPGQVLQITAAGVTGQIQGSQQPVTQQPAQPAAQPEQQTQQPYQPQQAQAQAPAQQPQQPQQPQAPAQPAQQAAADGQVSTAGMSSFEQCVIQAESGGNPSAVNPSSGAGGLFQFLPSTFASLGFSGPPQDASVATQEAAFAKEYAQSGTSAWAPYDGC